ncbi:MULTISPECIES: hypothetical protein [Rhizobium/Agrobacterium group]|jgi:hypothetical protein|uniref:hypothetical protein n=1 Tax=Rhizobium/Agrobacterium group TaxID=227290 RepID=UPI0002EFA864|nr:MULTISPECIES: hypothetical protein [Rhizobium/Agrobacterium group]KAB0462431.1 hypothetical protein F7R04_02290 [Agrobacterium tumefaciens]KQY53093.1 hypothetical protein ASD46_01175 [Rhizobium sp. Root491]KWT80529.1 hypothetical protein ASH09_04585 [Agrobacterium radiobacter]MDR5008319.1 hypothetical protein [Agrobacterium tumefaciens]NIB09244.1 hypothetical protein [Agrobacterium radiobacter]
MIIAKLKGYLAAIGTALAILAGVFLYGQRAGRTAAKDEQAAANAKAIKKAGDVEHEIKNLGDDDVDRRLTQWMRDKR